MSIGSEILLIFALVLLNGVLAMSEIALVSARKVRLRQRAETGDAGARAALELAESPGRLLSTVQIGITLVGMAEPTSDPPSPYAPPREPLLAPPHPITSASASGLPLFTSLLRVPDGLEFAGGWGTRLGAKLIDWLYLFVVQFVGGGLVGVLLALQSPERLQQLQAGGLSSRPPRSLAPCRLCAGTSRGVPLAARERRSLGGRHAGELRRHGPRALGRGARDLRRLRGGGSDCRRRPRLLARAARPAPREPATYRQTSSSLTRTYPGWWLGPRRPSTRSAVVVTGAKVWLRWSDVLPRTEAATTQLLPVHHSMS
jgi:hypothetical protein